MKVLLVALMLSSATLASEKDGRFQIVPAHSETRNAVYLIDTHTGRTWVNCVDSEKQSFWCPVSEGTATGHKEGAGQLSPPLTK